MDFIWLACSERLLFKADKLPARLGDNFFPVLHSLVISLAAVFKSLNSFSARSTFSFTSASFLSSFNITLWPLIVKNQFHFTHSEFCCLHCLFITSCYGYRKISGYV